jgi:hypothetical protein
MESRYQAWLNSPNRQRDEDLFSAYQNARVVKNGEAYYRFSFKGIFRPGICATATWLKRCRRSPGF